ncbi:Spo0E family sporulation regulatory protein-aspartic acid phosphatase [Aneurinibacillus sp. REN35]|uniref:Spo0E family sporulation regulatory protein-aspartic acid phosphatase n=1 Tax=Aneurinibacillus sp. REN35 TaxID=3237286 RepID=UPI003529897F
MMSMCIEYRGSEYSNQLDILQQEIAQLRENMYRLAKEKNSFTHPKVVEISQQLDAKLNLHDRFFRSH